MILVLLLFKEDPLFYYEFYGVDCLLLALCLELVSVAVECVVFVVEDPVIPFFKFSFLFDN